MGTVRIRIALLVFVVVWCWLMTLLWLCSCLQSSWDGVRGSDGNRDQNESWALTFHFFAENGSVALLEQKLLPTDENSPPPGDTLRALYIPPSQRRNATLPGSSYCVLSSSLHSISLSFSCLPFYLSLASSLFVLSPSVYIFCRWGSRCVWFVHVFSGWEAGAWRCGMHRFSYVHFWPSSTQVAQVHFWLQSLFVSSVAERRRHHGSLQWNTGLRSLVSIFLHSSSAISSWLSFLLWSLLSSGIVLCSFLLFFFLLLSPVVRSGLWVVVMLILSVCGSFTMMSICLICWSWTGSLFLWPASLPHSPSKHIPSWSDHALCIMEESLRFLTTPAPCWIFMLF